MKYRNLDGVVHALVCGENLLVATRPVWGKVQYIKPISALFASFWKGVNLGFSDEEMVQELLRITNMKEPAIRKSLHRFILEMTEEGYLFPEDTEQ